MGLGEIGFFIKLPFPSFWLSMDRPCSAPDNAYGPQPQSPSLHGYQNIRLWGTCLVQFFLTAMRLLFHSLLQVHAFISDTWRIPFLASKLSKELETNFFKNFHLTFLCIWKREWGDYPFSSVYHFDQKSVLWINRVNNNNKKNTLSAYNVWGTILRPSHIPTCFIFITTL